MLQNLSYLKQTDEREKMSTESLILSIDGPVATILLNRPEKRNAISIEMVQAMDKALDDICLNPGIRVVVLKGEGKCFAAGIDLMALMGLSQMEPKDVGNNVRVLAHRIQAVLTKIEDLEKPVVAMIHGFCGGLATELVMACDFRIARADTEVGLPEIYFGLLPDCGGTTRLTRTLGIARTKELVMLGDLLDAKTAHHWGLLTKVYKEADFETGCQAFVDKILKLPSLTLGLAKKLIDLGAHSDKTTFMDLEAALQSICITAQDFPETFQNGMAVINELKKQRQGK